MNSNESEQYYTGEEAGGSTVDIRPEGMTEKQDTIIQHVAEYVVNSCNSAAYYQKLREKTQFNVNFNFLEPSHPYYEYYIFLVESYQHWKNTAALAAEQTMPTTVAMTMDPGGNEVNAAAQSGLLGSFSDAYYPPVDATTAVTGVEIGVLPAPSSPAHEYDSSLVGIHRTAPDEGSVAAHAGGVGESMPMTVMNDDDDDDDDDYELVEVNGVKHLVPRKR